MDDNSSRKILRGQTLSFTGNPFEGDPASAVAHNASGGVLIEGGVVKAVADAGDLIAQNKGAAVVDYGDNLIMAGFIDAHIHYPQTEMIGAKSQGLVDWLKRHTFPCEERFCEDAIADATAELFLDLCLENGVTTAGVYCTVHPDSASRFFEAAKKRNLRMTAGKVCMDQNAPAALLDTAQSAYDDSKRLIETWHGLDRLHYVITPRFALTSTAAQLEALGALWKEYPDVLMQTHLSETKDEIEKVLAVHPSHKTYFDVYDAFGLAGNGAIFGHCIHLGDAEHKALNESGSSIAHCPTSNAFMGSGHFDIRKTRAAAPNSPLALCSDVGAGTSFSPFASMRAAYEAARHWGNTLHPAEAFYMASLGAATSMRMDDRVGNLAPNMDADLIVIDLKSTPLIAARVQAAEDIYDALFAQMIMADARAIAAVYVAGELSFERA